jgi:TIR domain
MIDMRWLPRNDVSVEAEDLDSYVLGLRSRDYAQTAIDSSFAQSEPVRRPLAAPQERAQGLIAGKTEPYVFVSYAHKNGDFATAVMQFLTSTGVSFWWDDGIRPGSVWDDALEERVSNCSVLLACLSADYQSSKYCRRELKFADHLGKQILPVARDPVGWSDGLRLMFQDLQILVLNSDQSWGRLRDSLANMAANVFDLTSVSSAIRAPDEMARK